LETGGKQESNKARKQKNNKVKKRKTGKQETLLSPLSLRPSFVVLTKKEVL